MSPDGSDSEAIKPQRCICTNRSTWAEHPVRLPLSFRLPAKNNKMNRLQTHLAQTRQMNSLIITARLPTRRIAPRLQKQIVVSSIRGVADQEIQF